MNMFPNSIYKDRRKKLSKALPPGSAILIPSWPLHLRSGDVHHPYRPHSDMLYFTGWEEEIVCLLLVRNSDQIQQVLFVQEKNPAQELWTGPINGPEEALEITEVDLCYSVNRFHLIAKELLKDTENLYYSFSWNPDWNQRVKKLLLSLVNRYSSMCSVHDSIQLTAPLRMKKSPEEIKLIQKAVDIAVTGHKEIMRQTRPGVTEKQLKDLFQSVICSQGATEEAYPGIFASGSNSCILHYNRNQSTLKSQDLLLVDAGAEYHYYTSDISRTFPINGKFSKVQKRIYNKLLKVQMEVISQLKPGVSFLEIQQQVSRKLSELMIEENLLTGDVESVLKNKEYKKYFPHNFGHSMGMDVHDPIYCPKNSPVLLTEGFVLTIEPGLYFPSNDSTIPAEYRGLGFRIEDDIVITKTGAQVLSKDAPKTPDELEELIGSK